MVYYIPMRGRGIEETAAVRAGGPRAVTKATFSTSFVSYSYSVEALWHWPCDQPRLPPPQISQLQAVSVEPLVYIGHQFVLDPLSNLVYLPTAKASQQSRGGSGGGGGGGARPAWGGKGPELDR